MFFIVFTWYVIFCVRFNSRHERGVKLPLLLHTTRICCYIGFAYSSEYSPNVCRSNLHHSGYVNRRLILDASRSDCNLSRLKITFHSHLRVYASHGMLQAHLMECNSLHATSASRSLISCSYLNKLFYLLDMAKKVEGNWNVLQG